jgi:hypothetical protein
MPAINAAMAMNLARETIAQLALSVGDQFDILLDETREVEQGWVFFFNTADFVRTRNPVYALAGNGPILVSRDGKVQELPTAVPWEDSLKKI